MEWPGGCLWLGALIAVAFLPTDSTDPSGRHSRQKRLIWITNDGRLALPPGTHLTITPTISLPFVRYPPDGFLSNMTISLPFTINFDSLGLTDNQNPYGVLPPILARSMGRASGRILADYIASLLDSKRKARAAPQRPPDANFHGGERALLYTIVEDLLANFGMDGKACLLRAICEVHGHSLHHFGLLGELLKVFFTASKSPYADLLEEYVTAEKSGLQDGECWRYFKDCPKSLFISSERNKYSSQESTTDHYHEMEATLDVDQDDLQASLQEEDSRTSEITLSPSEIKSKMMM